MPSRPPRRRPLLIAATFLLLTSAAARLAATPDSASDLTRGKQWWAHVQVLADDSMKGRLTGSIEYLKAAAYIVSQFKQYGLEPAGISGSFFQPVHFEVQRILADKSSLAMTTNGKTEPLTLGTDAILNARTPQLPHVEAPLVFLGYGLHLPEFHFDDFNSAEVPYASLRGKIVVVVNGGPADLPTALKSYARTSPLTAALRAAGALGIISISTPKSMDFGWERVASAASQPGMWLASQPGDDALAKVHPALAEDHAPRFTATFNPAQADKLLAGTGHTWAEIQALADAQRPLPHFDLGKSLTANVTAVRTQVESPNIAARLEGSDPALKSDYVLVSAHLDHLGVGAPIKGSTIYPGAMDDASGVATVLETARSFSEAASHGQRPRRSILFLIFTAEEKGLLGSRYFAGHPTVPPQSVKADLNLDMFMPIFPLKKLHVQGLEQSTLADAARKVGAAHNIVIATDPEPDRNSFVRTDQYSFVQAGVPALAMKFGWEAGSPEQKMWRAWLAERYHSTQDNLAQTVDFAAAAQFNSFFADLLRTVADDPATPHYLPDSFFQRFETGGSPAR